MVFNFSALIKPVMGRQGHASAGNCLLKLMTTAFRGLPQMSSYRYGGLSTAKVPHEVPQIPFSLLQEVSTKTPHLTIETQVSW